MNDVQLTNTSFSTVAPGLQISLDSTSIGALKRCSRYYELTIGDGIRHGYSPRSESAHLIFGIEYHSALELYDRLRAEGKDHDASVVAAVRQALIRTWRFDLKRPWPSDEPTKNRETLIRTIVWYLDQFATDPLETIILKNGKPAVELSFRFDSNIISGLSGEHYMLCGHIDRLVRFQGQVWIVDRKTTKSALSEDYFSRYSPNNQISLYSLAGTVIYGEPVAGVIIDAAQIGVTFSRFRRGIVKRTQAQLEEWVYDLRHWLRILEANAKGNYWHQNDESCDKYGGCPFRGICGMSPETRQKHLEALFIPRIWDPLQTREV